MPGQIVPVLSVDAQCQACSRDVTAERDARKTYSCCVNACQLAFFAFAVYFNFIGVLVGPAVQYPAQARVRRCLVETRDCSGTLVCLACSNVLFLQCSLSCLLLLLVLCQHAGFTLDIDDIYGVQS